MCYNYNYAVVEVGFDQVTVEVSELDKMAMLAVVKDGDNDVPVYINVSTMDGTAKGMLVLISY